MGRDFYQSYLAIEANNYVFILEQRVEISGRVSARAPPTYAARGVASTFLTNGASSRNARSTIFS